VKLNIFLFYRMQFLMQCLHLSSATKSFYVLFTLVLGHKTTVMRDGRPHHKERKLNPEMCESTVTVLCFMRLPVKLKFILISNRYFYFVKLHALHNV